MSNENHNNSNEHLVHAAKAYIIAHSREKFSLQAVADTLYIIDRYIGVT